jgi:hypothetical protein
MDPATNQTQPAAPPAPVVPSFQAVEHTIPETPNTPEGDTPNIPEAIQTQTVSTVQGANRGGGRKKILAALGIVLMLIGLGAGVFLIGNRQLLRTSAWDCSLYTFALSEDGTVTVANGSSSAAGAQQAAVYINNSLIDTFDVVELASGEGATLGKVSVPVNQSYTWRVEGLKDCKSSGSAQVSGIAASCSIVTAYDEDWTRLSAADLAALSEGNIIRFAISGTSSSGSFERARFSVNGAPAVEVTDIRPETGDFYYEYTIPAGIDNFNVGAEIFHSELGWF